MNILGRVRGLGQFNDGLIYRRLVKEFWFAAVVAAARTIYTRYQGHPDARSTIAAFASAFFLASWATSQFFRVQKQTHLDRNLLSIEERLTDLVALLEQRTQDLIGYATGSNSMIRFKFLGDTGSNILTFSVMNSSKYPVLDIGLDWIDLDEPGIDLQKGKFWTRHYLKIPDLWPSRMMLRVVGVLAREIRWHIALNSKGAARDLGLWTPPGAVAPSQRPRADGRHFHSARAYSPLMCILGAAMWTPALTFLAGAATAIFAEPFRQWIFRPVIEVSFNNDDRCVAKSPTGPTGRESEGFYVRVLVRTTNVIGARTAQGCRAYLVNVEVEEKGEFRPSDFADTLRLKWSSQLGDDTIKSIDIPQGVSQYVDVISTDRSAPHGYSAQTTLMPWYCRHLFDERPKILRLTVLVTGEDVKPAKTKFVFRWKGVWDTFEAVAD